MANLDDRANFALGDLVSGGIDGSSTTLSLVDASSFSTPVEGYSIVVFDEAFRSSAEDPSVEIMRATGKSGNDLTVVRGQEGTAAVAHQAVGQSYKCFHGPTKKSADDIAKIVEFFTKNSSTEVQVDPNIIFRTKSTSFFEDLATFVASAEFRGFVDFHRAAAFVLQIRKDADSAFRFRMNTDGVMQWGDGTGPTKLASGFVVGQIGNVIEIDAPLGAVGLDLNGPTEAFSLNSDGNELRFISETFGGELGKVIGKSTNPGRWVFNAPDAEIPVEELSRRQFSFYLDEAANELKVKVLYSDGLVKTGTVALTGTAQALISKTPQITYEAQRVVLTQV